jgi:hypothetical protein
MKWHRVA